MKAISVEAVPADAKYGALIELEPSRAFTLSITQSPVISWVKNPSSNPYGPVVLETGAI